MNNYRQITWRYLKQNKKRTILTIIGIVLAVSLFSAIGTFFYSFQDSMIEIKKDSNGNYEVSYLGLDKKQINYIQNNFNVSNLGIETMDKCFDCINEGKNSTLNLTYYDDVMFKDIKKFDIVEGSTPKNPNEIIIQRKAIIKLNKKLGDEIKVKIGNEEVIYKISGFYKSRSPRINDKCEAYGFLDKDNLKTNESYNVFVNFNDTKNIRNLGKELGSNLNLNKEEVVFNDGLLYAMMESGNSTTNKMLKEIIFIVFSIVIISAVTVIYNSFNISVAERVKQFGILRSIGASPGKIRRIVLKEGFVMCLISIPLGIILGYVGIYVVTKILIKYQSYGTDFDLFNISFYPQVILISAILGFITVFLSVISPAISASKISPMDAIRNSGKFKKEKIKRRKARLIKLLFGIEGQVAYKNIKRNNKRFIITIISLCISFIMFVGFTSFMIVEKGLIRSYVRDSNYDIGFSPMSDENYENVVSELKENKYVKDVYEKKGLFYPIYLESSFVNTKFLTIYQDERSKDDKKLKIGSGNYFELRNGSIQGWNEVALKTLEKNLVDGKIDLEALKDGGVILSDMNIKKENDKRVMGRTTKYKVGDIIRIPLMSQNSEENREYWENFHHKNEAKTRDRAKKVIEKGDYINAKVIGIVNQSNIMYSECGKLNLIFDKTAFEKKFFKLHLDEIGVNLKDKSEKVKDYFDIFAESNNLNYDNFEKIAKSEKSMEVIMCTFVYGFISIVSLISVINIINTITMGLLLRKREFATLNAIGMTKKQLSKMVLLEGILYGVIVSIIGSIASYGVFKLLTSITNQAMEIPYSPLEIISVFILGIIGINILTFIASLIPLRKFKKMNIIENIKEEE